ncbi:hypothetical protein [Nitrospira sp. Nam80]
MEPSKGLDHKVQCDDLMQERARYFMGRHLTARDFRDEQAYHRTHRLFHNRILHGWGVVCGLTVKQHARHDCRNRFVELTPGIAVDCCGREIAVECAPTCKEQGMPEIPWKDYKESRPLLLLCLCYDERRIEPVAVLHHEGDCSETKTDYGRYQDAWKLSWRWISESDLPRYEWKNQYGGCLPETQRQGQEHTEEGKQHSTEQTAESQPPSEETGSTEPGRHDKQRGSDHPLIVPGPPCPEDDCGDPCSEGFRSCIEPRCPPDHCIPLAIICGRPGQPVVNQQIIMKGRPELPYGPTRLTHIAHVNWPHGGVVTPGWFKQHRGRLVVKFNRKLRKADERPYPGPWGINEAIFLVQFGRQQEDLDFATFENPPRLLDNQCEAEYQIAPRRHHRDNYEYLEGHIVWITLKCDFLYDCHGVRVDGNNDGVAGGTFESWVTVLDEHECERMKKEGTL